MPEDLTCVGHCEIDKYANRSYNALFDTKGEWFVEDARKADPETMPDFRLLCGGFPCQTFSIAGSRKGFGDPRGTLFFELARLAEVRKPAYLLFENVPGLLNHTGKVVAINGDGSHLHFEVKTGTYFNNSTVQELYHSGIWVNPLNYITH